MSGDTNTVQDDGNEEYLFDNAVLTGLVYKDKDILDSSHVISGDFRIRALSAKDFDKGYVPLLAQLTKIGDITAEKYLARFNDMKACHGTYYVIVVEDLAKREVIASCTLMIERKFIRECALRGAVEDVVVSNAYRGKQLGKIIVTTAISLGFKVGCYKICLNCSDKLLPFYKSLGFICEPGNANFMVMRANPDDKRPANL